MTDEQVRKIVAAIDGVYYALCCILGALLGTVLVYAFHS